MHRQAKNSEESRYRRRAPFTRFNYHKPIHNPQETTVHRMLISTPLSPNPHRNLLRSDNALFPIWKKKKENQYLVSIRVEADRYHPQPSFSLLCSSSCFSLHLWQMVNRNNGVWSLGGQGAAGGENKAADESAWAGITPLTSLWSGVDKRASKTDKHVATSANVGLAWWGKAAWFWFLEVEEEWSWSVKEWKCSLFWGEMMWGPRVSGRGWTGSYLVLFTFSSLFFYCSLWISVTVLFNGAPSAWVQDRRHLSHLLSGSWLNHSLQLGVLNSL